MLSAGSLAFGLLSLFWLVFFIAQAFLPMPVHLPEWAQLRIGVPLTLALPIAAIVLGIAALVRIHAAGIQVIGFDQVAAMSGAILGGVVLLLCLLVVLWCIVLRV
jgi:hypothetical protein